MRNLLTSCLILVGMLANAQAINPDKAMTAALDFYNSISPSSEEGGAKKAPKAAVTSADLVRTTLQGGALEAFNVKDGRGFVLVAPDGDNNRIIGYSDKGSFDTSNLPPQLKKALENPMILKQGNARSNTPGTPVIKHETAEWGQYAPFNDLCPTVDGEKAPAGCVATAMAIAMKYHNWPDCTKGMKVTDYYSPTNSFDFSKHSINWNALEDKANPDFAKQAAELTYSAGVAAQMMWGPYESGADVWPIAQRLIQLYSYGKDCQFIPREKFSDSEWESILIQQLDDIGPVIYEGHGNGDHCFVIDGYDSNGLYHVNWGWDGGSNGYYSLDFSIEGGMSFGEHQSMIINMTPDREKKEYSCAFVSNANAYPEDVYGVNQWNFTQPDLTPGEKITFRTPTIVGNSLVGYLGIGIVDSNDNIQKILVTDDLYYTVVPTHCAYPGLGTAFYDIDFPELEEGQRFQLITDEIPYDEEDIYTPSRPVSNDISDWKIVLGGILNPSFFTSHGNPSIWCENHFHIDENMPLYSFYSDVPNNHELSINTLKGQGTQIILIAPEHARYTVEGIGRNNDGEENEAVITAFTPDQMGNNEFIIAISTYYDRSDIYIKYEPLEDTRHDSGIPKESIIDVNGLVYQIKEDCSALIGYDNVGETITIPESITKNGKQYPLTEIANEALFNAPVKEIVINAPYLNKYGNLCFAATKELESIRFQKFNTQVNELGMANTTGSALKTIYQDSGSLDYNLLNMLLCCKFSETELSVAVSNLDFILNFIPENLNDANILAEWQSMLGDKKLVNSYTLPGLGNSPLAQEIAGINLPIRQMWEYSVDKKNGIVRIENVIDNVKIESVFINGVEAENLGDGIYAIASPQPTRSGEEEELNVSINYSINGIAKDTAYTPEFNETVSNTNLGKNIESIILNPETWSGTEGDSFKIEATVLPEDASDKSIIWTSSDESIAIVDSEGNVTTLAAGEAVITATAADGSGVSASCNVSMTAKIILVGSIILNPETWNGTEGDSFRIEATVLPEDASDKSIIWTSSDESIAIVDSEGNVTTLAAGEAVITATAADGSGISASCNVSVIARIIPVESIILNPETWSGTEGDSFRIDATVLPEDASDKSIIWTSSDESIAIIDAEGNVTTLAAGEAVITATAADGSGVTSTCYITSAAGVDGLFGEAESFDVYNLNGILIKKNCNREQLKQLTPDIYFIHEGNLIKKIILR